jgi:hypothetical protein
MRSHEQSVKTKTSRTRLVLTPNKIRANQIMPDKYVDRQVKFYSSADSKEAENDALYRLGTYLELEAVLGGRVKVYECEGTPTDWLGLEVVGKGENWMAIERGMLEDLEDLSNQMKTRNERGDGALEGTERVIIVEEYPELVSKVPSSGEWLERYSEGKSFLEKLRREFG